MKPVRCRVCRGRITDAADLADHEECERERHHEPEPDLEPKDPRS